MRLVKTTPSEPGVVCVTGLPARTAKRSCRLFLYNQIQPWGELVPVVLISSRERRMRNWIKRRWILAVVAAAATVASYAQFSNPSEDVPAYHPSAPLRFAPLPPIMAGD